LGVERWYRKQIQRSHSTKKGLPFARQKPFHQGLKNLWFEILLVDDGTTASGGSDNEKSLFLHKLTG
jgi:hypothetical protein